MLGFFFCPVQHFEAPLKFKNNEEESDNLWRSASSVLNDILNILSPVFLVPLVSSCPLGGKVACVWTKFHSWSTYMWICTSPVRDPLFFPVTTSHKMGVANENSHLRPTQIDFQTRGKHSISLRPLFAVRGFNTDQMATVRPLMIWSVPPLRGHLPGSISS